MSSCGTKTPLELESAARPYMTNEKAADSLRRSANRSCATDENSHHSSSNEVSVTEDSYLHGTDLVVLILILMVGQFILGLDATVIATALPRITADFRSLDDIGWYGAVYLLATTATQPTWSKIYHYYNIKWLFVVSVLIFELGSVVCAVASSSRILILGRAIAGVGQGAMLSGGAAVITVCIPLDRRALFFALGQSMNGIASVCGPPLGGVFTDSARLTWRFCFWINLPIGVILIVGDLIYFRNPKRPPSGLSLKEEIRNLDLAGALLFALIWVCLFLALDNGGSRFPWSDVRVWGWFIGFGLSLAAFMALQKRLGDAATIPLRLLANKSMIFTCLYTVSLAIGFSTFAYFLPFYFQSSKGVSAVRSGLYMIPFLGAIMISCVAVGGLMIVAGTPSPFMLFGAVAFTVAAALLTTLKTDSPTGLWVGLQILLGAGFGSTLQLALVVIQATLGEELAVIGNGLFFVSNFGGGSLGVSFANAIFQNVLVMSLRKSVPQLNASAVLSAGATAITSAVPSKFVPAVQEAYAFAITRAFLLPTATAAFSCICIAGIKWISLKKPGNE